MYIDNFSSPVPREMNYLGFEWASEKIERTFKEERKKREKLKQDLLKKIGKNKDTIEKNRKKIEDKLNKEKDKLNKAISQLIKDMQKGEVKTNRDNIKKIMTDLKTIANNIVVLDDNSKRAFNYAQAVERQLQDFGAVINAQLQDLRKVEE